VVSDIFKPSVHWLPRVNEGEEADGRGTNSGRGGEAVWDDFLSTHVEEGGRHGAWRDGGCLIGGAAGG
jgi:hypothetical protein